MSLGSSFTFIMVRSKPGLTVAARWSGNLRNEDSPGLNPTNIAAKPFSVTVSCHAIKVGPQTS
ncbi:expansin family protein [Moniliophthora roreri]|nr:expansin family protein [Moniliophthora roreri]